VSGVAALTERQGLPARCAFGPRGESLADALAPSPMRGAAGVAAVFRQRGDRRAASKTDAFELPRYG